MNWILDLDGVVWLAADPVPGSVDAIARLRDAGHRVLFITNNSSRPVQELVDKLDGLGIPADRDDLITSAQAGASLLEAGSSALVCAGAGVEEALRERDVDPVEDGPADAVVVGFHRHFDYDRLTAAYRTVTGGARFIGTNDDATYPTPDGPIPGGGAILAAVATAAGVEPEVAGKPHEAMASLVRERLGGTVDDSVMVGDRVSTDGLMAGRLEIPFLLVLSGVTTEADLPIDPEPARVAPDLGSLVGDEGGLVDAQELA